MLLIEKYPESIEQFVEDLNPNISLTDLGIGSTKKVWWKCNKNEDHIWQASPNQRASGKKLRGCSICTGKTVSLSSSIKATHPLIAAEFHPTKNQNLTKERISQGSNKKVWWKCSLNKAHEWLASPKQRTKQNNTCPICNSLETKYPHLSNQLHPTLNNGLTGKDVSFSTHLDVWWKCDKGFDHVWQASPNNRTSMNTGCPICSGHKVVKSNSLATVFPELALQWDYEKNKELTPDKVYARSSLKVWWICNKGSDHKWASVIKTRANGIGCPICSGRKVSNSNSLSSRYPDIATMWHPSKNEKLSPLDVTPFANNKVWWKCKEGDDHEWETTVANFVNGSTCPVCMGRKITKTNNFEVLYPELMKEWDFESNSLLPNKISPGSKEKVWWVCSKNIEHKWFSTIKDRTSNESGCPICSIKLNVSETKMLELLKEMLPKNTIKYRYKPKWLQRMELDVYIEELNVGFEYQGIQHFKAIDFFGGEETFLAQVTRDKLKKELCIKNNIILIEVYYDEKISKQLLNEKLMIAGISTAYNIGIAASGSGR